MLIERRDSGRETNSLSLSLVFLIVLMKWFLVHLDDRSCPHQDQYIEISLSNLSVYIVNESLYFRLKCFVIDLDTVNKIISSCREAYKLGDLERITDQIMILSLGKRIGEFDLAAGGVIL